MSNLPCWVPNHAPVRLHALVRRLLLILVP